MEFSRQEFWNGLPFPTPGALPDPGIEPESSASAGRFFTTAPLGNPTEYCKVTQSPRWRRMHALDSVRQTHELIYVMLMQTRVHIFESSQLKVCVYCTLELIHQ